MHGSFTDEQRDNRAADTIFDGTVESVSIPEPQVLSNARFERSGDSLKIVAESGKVFLIQDYFKSDRLAPLVTPDGYTLAGDTVLSLAGPRAPNQYAQAGAPAGGGQQQIGAVDKVSGSVTVIRNGVSVTLNAGDPILKSDIIQTGANGSVVIMLIDGTALTLGANTRMAMNEFSFDPNSTNNSSLLNLLQGSFVFVAGQIAPNGGLNIETPVATMGIRGTEGGAECAALCTIVATQGTYELRDSTGRLIGTVTVGSPVQVSPTTPGQTPQVVVVDASTVNPTLFQMAAQLSQAYSQMSVPTPAPTGPQGPQNPNPTPQSNPSGGSSTDPRLLQNDAAPPLPTPSEPPRQVVVVVNQPDGTQTTVTFTPPTLPDVQPTALPPVVVSGIANQVINEDTTWNFPVLVGPNGTFDDPDTANLTLTASMADGSALPNWLTFSNGVFSGTPPQDAFGQLNLMVTASDGTSSVAVVFTLTVVNVPDAPVLTLPAGPASLLEDGSIDLTGGAVTDADFNDLITLKVDVEHGTLQALAELPEGVVLIAGGTGEKSITLQGPTAAISNLLNSGARYTPDPNYNGNDTLTVTVTDSFGLTATKTTPIVVTPVNDAPSGANTAVTTAEDTDFVFTAADFGFSDPADGDAFIAVKITTLPSAGTLKLKVGDGTVPVTAGQTIAIADINAGKLTLTPAANANGNNHATFTFQVQDSGGVANGGQDLDPTPNTITVNFTPVNDAPTLVVEEPFDETVEGMPLLMKSDDDTPVLFDPDIGDIITLTFEVDHGQLTLAGELPLNILPIDVDGSDGSITVRGSVDALNTLMTQVGLNYAPLPGFNGDDAFTITAVDVHGAQDVLGITIEVQPANGSVQEDAPISSRTVSGLAGANGPVEEWSVEGGVPSGPVDYIVKIDSFSVVSSNGLDFQDDFGNGTPPPSPNYAINSFQDGQTTVQAVVQESGGYAILDSDHALPINAVGTLTPLVGHFVNLITSVNPTVNQGLRQAHDFTVQGRFDLDLPDDIREGFGIRLTDQAMNQSANDGLELIVVRGNSGQVTVQLRHLNYSTGTVSILDAVPLNAEQGETQIVLRFVHEAGSDLVYAAFDLVNSAGELLRTVELPTPGQIFHGENFTQAGFFAIAPSPALSYLQGDYGTLSVDQEGRWVYALANQSEAVQALGAGDFVYDTFTILADHGAGIEETPISIKVTGTNDAPVLSLGSEVFLDTFSSWGYHGWVEIGDDDGGDLASFIANHPLTGDFQIAHDPATAEGNFQLRLADADAEADSPDIIQRSFDLRGLTSAQLTFDFRRNITDDSSSDGEDDFLVFVSSDGVNFTQVGNIGRPEGANSAFDNGYQTFTLDLTPFLSDNTTIRFQVGDDVDDGDIVYVDNVRITERANYVQGGNPVPIGSNVQILDVDAGARIHSATIELNNVQQGDYLAIGPTVLSQGSTGDVSGIHYDVTVTGGSIIITLTGPEGGAPASAFKTVIGSVTFANNAAEISNIPRDVKVTVNDGLANSNAAVMTIGVVGGNEAPVLTSDNVALPAVAEDTLQPLGATIADLLAGKFQDADGDHFVGVAIVANTAESQGTWQFSGCGMEGWADVGSVSEWQALVLHKDVELRFVPAANYSGSPPPLAVHAIDSTYEGEFTYTNLEEGTVRVTMDVSLGHRGGTTPVSEQAVDIGVTVTPVADAPVIEDAPVGEAEFTVNANVANGQEAPQVIKLSDGRVLFVWSSNDPVVDGNFFGIAARVGTFNQSGELQLGDEFTVNTVGSGSQGAPQVTELPNGKLLFTWTTGTGTGGIQGRVGSLDENGVITWLPDFNISSQQNEGSQQAIPIDGLGTVVVVWSRALNGGQDGYNIVARIGDPEANTFGEEFIVNEFASVGQFNPQVVMLSDGRLLFTWETVVEGYPKVVARIASVTGELAWGDQFSLADNNALFQERPQVIELSDGRLLAMWKEQGDIRARVGQYQQGEIDWGASFSVNEGFGVGAETPQVTQLADGRLVFTWVNIDFEGVIDPFFGLMNQRGIAARVASFDAEGEIVWSAPFIVDERGVNDQQAPQVIETADGRLLFTWQSWDPAVDGDNSAIAARLFSVGTVSGPEDSNIDVPLHITLTDTTEVLQRIVIDGLPAEVSLAVGERQGDAWVIDRAQGQASADLLDELIGGHTLTLLPDENFNGQFTLSITAVSRDPGNGHEAASAVAQIPVTITPVNDAPAINFGAAHLAFDGSGYARGPIATQEVGNGSDGVTLEAWVRWDGSGTDGQVLLYHGSPSDSGFGLFGIVSEEVMTLSVLVGGSGFINTGTELTAGAWHHVAVTHEGGEFHLYVDGDEVSLPPFEGVVNSIPGGNPVFTWIGGTGDGEAENEGFHGAIAEVRVWDVTRSQQEIEATRFTQLSGNEAGLVGYWPLDDGSGTTAVGRAGSLQDLTVTGAQWVAGTDSWPVIIPRVFASEDTPLTIHGVSLVDIDAGNESVSVTLTVAHGTIELANYGTLLGNPDNPFGVVGAGTNQLTLSGHFAEVHAALSSGIVYTPDLEFSGPDTLTVVADDDGLTDRIDIGITVAGVNAAPVANGETLVGNIADFTYNPTNGHWYKINTTPLSWTDANAAAIAAGGYLATITSESENTFITSVLEAASLAVPAAWIGASDSVIEGDWRWMGGPEEGSQFWNGGPASQGGFPLMYANWRAPLGQGSLGEPNNSGTEDHAYIMANSPDPVFFAGTWNDTPAAAPLASMIEVSFVEDTVSVIPAAFLLANDTDAEGDELVIHGLPSTDTAAGGNVQFTPEGNIQYTPASNFSGLDSFTYQVRDGSGAISNPATVSFYVSPGTFASSTLTFDELTAGQQLPAGYGGFGPFDGFEAIGMVAINPDDENGTPQGLGVFEDATSALISLDGTEFTIASFTLGDLAVQGVAQSGLQSLTVYGYNGDQLVWIKEFDQLDSDPDTPELLSGFSNVAVTNVEFQGAEGQFGTIDNFVFTTVPSIRGTVGADTLHATPVGNRVIGYGGNDDLYGNSGADTFVFHSASGDDQVHNFDVSLDKIELFGMGPEEDSFGELSIGEDLSGNATITHHDTDVITLLGINPNTLQATNFVLHPGVALV